MLFVQPVRMNEAKSSFQEKMHKTLSSLKDSSSHLLRVFLVVYFTIKKNSPTGQPSRVNKASTSLFYFHANEHTPTV
jgi:hypothetical protein